VHPEDILEEALARDTDGNAFFSRRLHTDVLGLQKLMIVTSDFHMNRTIVIFNHVFSLRPLSSGEYSLSFTRTANAGVDKEALEARIEKEDNTTVFYQENVQQMKTISEYHQFLYKEHLAYASERLIQKPDKHLDKDVGKTYVEEQEDAPFDGEVFYKPKDPESDADNLQHTVLKDTD